MRAFVTRYSGATVREFHPIPYSPPNMRLGGTYSKTRLSQYVVQVLLVVTLYGVVWVRQVLLDCFRFDGVFACVRDDS